MRKSYRKIIYALARGGEATQYELKAATGLNYASVHEAIKQLLANQLIKETRQETGPGPIPKRFFGLTLKGLAEALRWNDKDLSKHMERIAEKWGHLVPILNKIDLFRKHGLEEQFKEKVAPAIAIQYTVTCEGVAVFPEYCVDAEEYIIHYFSRMADADSMVKWSRVLYEDEELRRKTKSQLERDSAYLKDHLSVIKERLEQVFPLLENANPDWERIREVEEKLSRPHIILLDILRKADSATARSTRECAW